MDQVMESGQVTEGKISIMARASIQIWSWIGYLTLLNIAICFFRVLGGTAAKGGTIYHDKRGSGGVLSDLGRHGLQDGEPLKSSFFPIVYPKPEKEEMAERDSGKVGRNPVDIVTKIGGLATKASGERFSSFFKVLGSR